MSYGDALGRGSSHHLLAEQRRLSVEGEMRQGLTLEEDLAGREHYGKNDSNATRAHATVLADACGRSLLLRCALACRGSALSGLRGL